MTHFVPECKRKKKALRSFLLARLKRAPRRLAQKDVSPRATSHHRPVDNPRASAAGAQLREPALPLQEKPFELGE